MGIIAGVRLSICDRSLEANAMRGGGGRCATLHRTWYSGVFCWRLPFSAELRVLFCCMEFSGLLTLSDVPLDGYRPVYPSYTHVRTVWRRSECASAGRGASVGRCVICTHTLSRLAWSSPLTEGISSSLLSWSRSAQQL